MDKIEDTFAEIHSVKNDLHFLRSGVSESLQRDTIVCIR